MPYFNASTANPTGFRPWNFALQTSGQRLGYLRGGQSSGLGRLGLNILTSLPASVQQQVQSIIQYLQQAQADINATNLLLQQANAAGRNATNDPDIQAIAQNNLANQNQLSTLTDEFTTGYRAMTGTVPPGLSGLGRFGRFRGLRGLGQVDPASWLTVAGAIAAIAALLAAAYALVQQTTANKINAQAKVTQSQTAQAAQQQATQLQNQAAAACAAGDPSCASLTTLSQQASNNVQATSAAQGSQASWWNDPGQALVPGIANWMLVAGVSVVGALAIPRLIGR
jgi:hypothetical protein